MDLLASPIRGYAWGSHTVIAAIQGRAVPTRDPEAELWMGAHPDSPSRVIRPDSDPVPGDVPLADLVMSDPADVLGADVLDRFGPRLPFMLKVLAAESPLSLQAHPDAETAARRYAEEAEADGDRLYTDPYPKPELVVALGDIAGGSPLDPSLGAADRTDGFAALCGFRDPADSAAVLASLRVEALAPVIAALRTGTEAERLRAAVEMLLQWPDGSRTEVVAQVVAAAKRKPSLGYVADLGTRFPGDLGVVVAMLLNHIVLTPDEAIWMPAGNLHAYLSGACMEALASSDNVLRGGFTSKRIAVGELLRVLRFDVLRSPIVKPVEAAPGLLTWPAPAEEFTMYRADVTSDTPVTIDLPGPRIVFCRSGAVTADDGTPLDLTGGQSAFGRAGRPLSLRGTGVVYIATTGATA